MLYYFTLIENDESQILKRLFKRIELLQIHLPSLPYSTLRITYLLSKYHARKNKWRPSLSFLEDFNSEVKLFKDSKLADYLDEFMYFLFLKGIVQNEETVDGITVHYQQERKAVLCLDEWHIFSHWGNHRGIVSLAKKILLFDYDEVVLLNMNRFKMLSKKNAKMHYLRRHIKHFVKDFKERNEYYDENYI